MLGATNIEILKTREHWHKVGKWICPIAELDVGGGKISGIISFSVWHFHLIVMFFVSMYLSVIMFSRSCILNSEKSKDYSLKLHL